MVLIFIAAFIYSKKLSENKISKADQCINTLQDFMNITQDNLKVISTI